MRHHIKSIGKESTIYSISNILTRAIGFILIPVYTKYLSTDQYGIISIVASLISFVAIFYNFGMSSTWSRFYFDYKDHSKEQKVFLGNIILFVVCVGLFASIIFTFFGKNIFESFAPGVDFYPFILLGIWSSFFLNFFNIQLEIYRIRGMSWKYAGYSLTKFIGTVVLTVIAIAVYKFGALGKVVSEFIVIFFTAIFALYKLASDIKINFQPQLIKKAVLFAFPLFLHQISSLTYIIADKFFLANHNGLSDTGIYNLGFQFGSIMSLIVGSIQLSWYTFFMNTLKENKEGARPVISRLITYYIMATLLIGMAIVFYSDEVIRVFTRPEYYGAVKLIPVFVFGFFFQGLYYIEVTKLYYDKKSVKYLPIISLISAIANIVLNYFLVPVYGIMGAAFSSLFTMFILFVCTLFVGQKAYFVPYELKRILILVSVVAILTIIKFQIQQLNISFFLLTFLKTLLLLVFPVYVLFGRFLSESESDNYKDIVRKVILRYRSK
jgi:O-antigen/teichoic acid export membrane protein